MNQRPWGGRPATRLRTWAKANLPWICAWCGQPIQPGLPFNHPDAWSLDHVQARHHGGDVYSKDNVIPMHRRCNSRKGKRLGPTANAEPHSRQW